MKFLIVDDSADMRRCIRQFLPDTAETMQCRDGLDAIAAFAQHRPDWILMDIEMKPLDGLAATRQFKAHWPEAKIIFDTSHDQPRFREAASQLNAQGYVIKENLEQINQIIGRTRSGSFLSCEW